jgi:N-acetyl-anhydromuramyl-L-alanine amidase AmpD
MRALGIMLVGDFSGENHVGKGDPTKEQLNSLKELTDFLRKKYNIQRSSIYGHKDFGKPSCPGYITMEFIKNYRESTDE